MPAPLEFLFHLHQLHVLACVTDLLMFFRQEVQGELTWTVEDSLGNTANLINLCDQLYTCYVTDVLGVCTC